LVGVDIDLTKNLSVDIGFRYFATEAESDHDYYRDYYYEYYSPHLDYKISMVTLGLKFRF
jgi:opacity protein-like surface antigen